MPRSVLVALLLLWPASPAFAQGDAKPAAQQDPEAAYQALTKAMSKAVTDWREQMRKTASQVPQTGKPVPAISMMPPTKPFVERAQELAAAFAGKDDAVPFLAFICEHATDEKSAARGAVRALLASHVESKRIGDALRHVDMVGVRFGAREDVTALLDAVIAKNKDADCQAHALLVRGSMQLQAASTDAQRAAGKADLQRAAQIAMRPELQQHAAGALFEVEHLQVGCTAPDIAGKDMDGVAFKLGDYRGKVVLLDFWGILVRPL